MTQPQSNPVAIFYSSCRLTMEDMPYIDLGEDEVIDDLTTAALLSRYCCERWPEDEILSTWYVDEIAAIQLIDYSQDDENSAEELFHTILHIVTPEDREKARALTTDMLAKLLIEEHGVS